MWRVPILACAMMFVACSASGAKPDGCQPSITEADPLQATEVRADASDGREVWALIFNGWELGFGVELRMPVGQEVKIVWRVPGEGDVSFHADGPDGEGVEPVWGPDRHLGSNWERPGDEYGTGWLIPSAGCWTLTVERGGAGASIGATMFEE